MSSLVLGAVVYDATQRKTKIEIAEVKHSNEHASSSGRGHSDTKKARSACLSRDDGLRRDSSLFY